ncbi:MAG: hypothetical protein IJT34_04765 [Butyrivibrio sp.]|nr:hypothetical protein [Butyrivibrio sp.]
MINFEEELKKFRPSLEVEDAESIITGQDLDDMSDVLVDLIKETREIQDKRPSDHEGR